MNNTKLDLGWFFIVVALVVFIILHKDTYQGKTDEQWSENYNSIYRDDLYVRNQYITLNSSLVNIRNCINRLYPKTSYDPLFFGEYYPSSEVQSCINYGY